jgi:hypothetical protein
MFSRTDVTVRTGNVTVSPAPLFGSAATGTVPPSENWSVAPVIWSALCGRS